MNLESQWQIETKNNNKGPISKFAKRKQLLFLRNKL